MEGSELKADERSPREGKCVSVEESRLRKMNKNHRAPSNRTLNAVEVKSKVRVAYGPITFFSLYRTDECKSFNVNFRR